MAESSRPKNLPPAHKTAKFPLPKPKAEDSTLPTKLADLGSDWGRDSEELEWENLVGALRLHRRHFLRIPGVTAVDIGYKLNEDTRQFCDELALRVHVERKRPLEYFKDHPHELICKSSKPPEEPEAAELYRLLPSREYRGPGGPVTMDIIEAKYLPAALPQLPRRAPVLETPRNREEVDRRRRLDPLVGGISIGNTHTPVGTLGALVWDKTDGTVCILSNWHVLAGNMHAEAGSPCFQPGRFDQGRSCDIVARLKRWSFDRQTDAAIAELTGSRHYCAGEILDLYQQISGTTEPYLGMIVLKSGRSTAVTKAFIDGLYFSTIIEYSNGVVREFEDQIHIAPLPPQNPSDPILPISDSGDSGSVWFTKNSDGYIAVGLHFAGDLPRSAFGEYALANPICVVENNLQFSFRPLFLEIRDEDAMSAPGAQAAQMQRRDGAQPINIVLNGLTGSGNQPEDDKMGSGG